MENPFSWKSTGKMFPIVPGRVHLTGAIVRSGGVESNRITSKKMFYGVRKKNSQINFPQ